MKILQALVLISVFVSFAFSQNLEKGETLKGTVKDESGAAISNVKIIAINSDGLDLTSLTNEDGKYDLYLPAGNYSIEFIAPKGFANHKIANYNVNAKSKAEGKLNVVLEINSEHTIVSEFQCKPLKNNDDFDCDYISKLEKTDNLVLSGNVLNLNGKILKNVMVKAVGENNQNFLTKSNENGFYYLVLPFGKYKVEFRKKRFTKHIYLTLEVNSSNTGKLNLDIRLETFKAVTLID